MTRFLAMVRNAAGSRRLPPEALAGKLRDEAAELEREQRLERVRRGEPRAPDHLVDMPAVRPDAGEHAPLVGRERRLGGGRACRREACDEVAPEPGEDVLRAGDQRAPPRRRPGRPRWPRP